MLETVNQPQPAVKWAKLHLPDCQECARIRRRNVQAALRYHRTPRGVEALRRAKEKQRSKDLEGWVEQVATHLELSQKRGMLTRLEDAWMGWPANSQVTIAHYVPEQKPDPESQQYETHHDLGCPHQDCICKSPGYGQLAWALLADTKPQQQIAQLALNLCTISGFIRPKPMSTAALRYQKSNAPENNLGRGAIAGQGELD